MKNSFPNLALSTFRASNSSSDNEAMLKVKVKQRLWVSFEMLKLTCYCFGFLCDHLSAIVRQVSIGNFTQHVISISYIPAYAFAYPPYINSYINSYKPLNSPWSKGCILCFCFPRQEFVLHHGILQENLSKQTVQMEHCTI